MSCFQNDVVVSVGGVKVNSSKQAVRLIKQAGDRFTIRIERSSSLKGLGPLHSAAGPPDFKVEEEAVLINKQVLCASLPVGLFTELSSRSLVLWLCLYMCKENFIAHKKVK